jgi:fructose-bisphosphate aldolase class II
MARGAIQAAEELNSPIILQLAEVHLDIAPIMLEAAKTARIPVAVHYDHGTRLDFILKALNLGLHL